MSKNSKKNIETKKLVMVISKGTLDMAYPPLILATSAAAMGMEVDLYFTFWGLDLLNKNKINSIKMAPVGNPGLPMPNIIGMLPGMTSMATSMMKGRIKKYWPTIPEMMKSAKDAGVRIHACSPTMGLMKVDEKELIPEVNDIIGASTYLDLAIDADVSLFI